jgi:flagella synthesis protein FlgN
MTSSVNSDEILSQQVHQLNLLLDVLEKELTALSQRELDQFVTLTENKQQLLDAVEKTDKAIRIAFTKTAPTPEQIPKFESIRTLVEECKSRSQVNEIAVQQSQTRLNHLQHLLVEGRQKESMTYDKAGRVSGSLFSKGVKA